MQLDEAGVALITGRPHLHVVAGPTLVGKTNRLIDLAELGVKCQFSVLAFKHALDVQRHGRDLRCHHPIDRTFPATPVEDATEILRHVQASGIKRGVVLVDEAQFFEDALLSAIETMLAGPADILVACSGLPLDYLGRPFGPVPNLLAAADSIALLRGVCTCGAPATRSIRTSTATGRILVDDHRSYAPACRRCAVNHVDRMLHFKKDF